MTKRGQNGAQQLKCTLGMPVNQLSVPSLTFSPDKSDLLRKGVFLVLQGQIWPTVTSTGSVWLGLALQRLWHWQKTRNKADLNRSNITFLKTRVKTEKLEKLEIFSPGILWDRPRGVAKAVVRISPHYRGKNGSLVPIRHKGRFLPLENSKKQNVKTT